MQMSYRQGLSFVCRPVGSFDFSSPILFWYLQCFTHSRLEFRMPPCRWVLSKDCLLFVNQWDHSNFHLRYLFLWYLQCLRTPDWILECFHANAVPEKNNVVEEIRVERCHWFTKKRKSLLRAYLHGGILNS